MPKNSAVIKARIEKLEQEKKDFPYRIKTIEVWGARELENGEIERYLIETREVGENSKKRDGAK